MASDREPLEVIDRVVTPVLGVVASLVLFCLMILTCADVIGRYVPDLLGRFFPGVFVSKPVYGAFEITEMLLAALIFAGLPLVTLRDEHVTVDVLDGVTPDWLLRVEHVISCILSAAASGYLAWRLWVRAIGMDAAGETTAQLKFKLAYLTYAMSILMALTALALLVLTLRRPRRQTTGDV